LGDVLLKVRMDDGIDQVFSVPERSQVVIDLRKDAAGAKIVISGWRGSPPVDITAVPVQRPVPDFCWACGTEFSRQDGHECEPG
jgi:hypothetical protein